MPPTSSPVHRLSSAPSAASTVLNIASRSPPHPLATSPRVREGRSPRPLLVDVIATPRHHIATDRPATRGAARRAVCHPARLASLLFRLLSSPSAPSPAAHQVAPPTKEREERAPCPALGGCHRHHLATDRPATRRAAPRSVCHPARLVLFPVLFPSIRW